MGLQPKASRIWSLSGVCTGCIHDNENAKIMVREGWIVYWCWRAGKATKVEKFRDATPEERRVMEYHRQQKTVTATEV